MIKNKFSFKIDDYETFQFKKDAFFDLIHYLIFINLFRNSANEIH